MLSIPLFLIASFILFSDSVFNFIFPELQSSVYCIQNVSFEWLLLQDIKGTSYLLSFSIVVKTAVHLIVTTFK